MLEGQSTRPGRGGQVRGECLIECLNPRIGARFSRSRPRRHARLRRAGRGRAGGTCPASPPRKGTPPDTPSAHPHPAPPFNGHLGLWPTRQPSSPWRRRRPSRRGARGRGGPARRTLRRAAARPVAVGRQPKTESARRRSRSPHLTSDAAAERQIETASLNAAARTSASGASVVAPSEMRDYPDGKRPIPT